MGREGGKGREEKDCGRGGESRVGMGRGGQGKGEARGGEVRAGEARAGWFRVAEAGGVSCLGMEGGRGR